MLLRPAEPDDAINVARVHVQSWQKAYRSLIPDGYLDQLRPEDRASRYRFQSPNPADPWTIVAVEAGSILGFVTTAPAPDPAEGELSALHVDPAHWNRGIGVALVSAGRKRLFDLGFRTAILWVLIGNTRAERFYRIDGWMPDGQRRTERVWEVDVEEIRYQRQLK